MQIDDVALSRFSNYHRKRGIVEFDGFLVPRENLTRSANQISAILAVDSVQRQFIGTMVDTEVAAGYFFRKSKVWRGTWVAYVAVKMKYGGDLRYLADLVGHIPPGRHLNKNTIMKSYDLRWSLMVQGVVAYVLLREVRPYLHNEKSIIEVDCILKHGPTVDGSLPHPFVSCGGVRVRRGVWYWSDIDDEGDGRPFSIAPKYDVPKRGSMETQPEHEEHEHMEPREPNTIYVGKKPTIG